MGVIFLAKLVSIPIGPASGIPGHSWLAPGHSWPVLADSWLVLADSWLVLADSWWSSGNSYNTPEIFYSYQIPTIPTRFLADSL